MTPADPDTLLSRWIARASLLLPPAYACKPPWRLTTDAADVITQMIRTVHQSADYNVVGDIAVHRSAVVEAGAVLKPPALIGPRAFVATGAYLRGGVFLDEGCIIGPGCEVKSTFLFAGSKIAHLSFVGDSVIGGRANVEAGAVIANYRNERDDKRIRIFADGVIYETGVDKFGAALADGVRIGANAVIAPGALLAPGFVAPRLSLTDQSAPSDRPAPSSGGGAQPL